MSKKPKSFILNNEQYKLLIPGYPEGSDITVLNTSYVPRKKVEDEEGNTKYEKDYIFILFRDNKKGKKKTYIIYEPLYTFYKLNDDIIPTDYVLFFIPKEYVTPYTCKYSNILQAIAEVTNMMDYYKYNVDNKIFSENKKLHTIPSIFMSDMNIENYYRFLFGLSYPNNIFKLSKAYLDIETDGRYAMGDFPEPGEVPINAIAYCDEENNTTYQFIFDDPRNPALQEYKRLFSKKDVISELKDFVINAVGGYKKAVKYGVDNMQYKIIFFKDELEMLEKMFDIINKTEPDFINIWNMSFDLTYIMARIYELQGNILDTICDKRISPKFLRYYVDERNKNNFEERGDFVAISSHTVWNDQMITFASRRKGRGAYPSFALNAIGEDVANVKKLDYSNITKDINMLPYIDFKTFSFYNIMDVIVQKCIERITADCDYIFTKCLVNNTSYAKCHRQSVYLANRFAKDFYNYGYIIGNNKNIYNEKPNIKFTGAQVGDPLHNNPDITYHINNKPTMLMENCVDFDYSSLYPSIVLENNMAPNTQYGRIIIEDESDINKTYSRNEHQDMFSNDDDPVKYSRGGEFLDNLMTSNILEFCWRWLNLGDIYDVESDIKEFYNFNSYNNGPSIDTSLKDAVYFTKSKMTQAFIENNYNASSAIIFDIALDKSISDNIIEDIKKGAIL